MRTTWPETRATTHWEGTTMRLRHLSSKTSKYHHIPNLTHSRLKTMSDLQQSYTHVSFSLLMFLPIEVVDHPRIAFVFLHCCCGGARNGKRGICSSSRRRTSAVPVQGKSWTAWFPEPWWRMVRAVVVVVNGGTTRRPDVVRGASILELTCCCACASQKMPQLASKGILCVPHAWRRRATSGASSWRRAGCPRCILTRRPTSSLCTSAAVHRRWKSGKRKAGGGHCTNCPFLLSIAVREAKSPPLPEAAMGPARGHHPQEKMLLEHSNAIRPFMCVLVVNPCWIPSKLAFLAARQ